MENSNGGRHSLSPPPSPRLSPPCFSPCAFWFCRNPAVHSYECVLAPWGVSAVLSLFQFSALFFLLLCLFGLFFFLCTLLLFLSIL